jgi:anti-anti-sigma factor
MDPVAVIVSQAGATTVVSPVGDHDLSTAPELASALASSASGPVVVDMTDTSFIDSSILGVILTARSRADEHGHSFVCVVDPAAAPSVARIFELTGLNSTFVIADSRDRALELVDR